MRLCTAGICVVLCMLVNIACAPAPSTVTSVVPAVTVEPSTLLPSPTIAVSPTSAPTPVPLPVRAVLISVPGGCANAIRGWAADGTMPSLAANGEPGEWTSIKSIEPATSLVAHASLATGRYPDQTGITGERVHRSEDGFYWYTGAYDLSLETDPLWAALQRGGLTTAALFWPGAMPDENQLADYTVGYGERVAYSNIHTLSLYPAGQWKDASLSFSPLLEAQFAIEDLAESVLATLYVLAVDSTDDGIANYDNFVLSLDHMVDSGDAALRDGEWVGLPLDASQGLGADFLITEVTSNSLTLFHSGVFRFEAAPGDFRQRIVEEFGFFAPAPDYYALEHNWITEEQYLNMVRRQSEWMMDLTLWVDEQVHPDLLMTVQYPLEQTAYQFLLIDERQPEYSAERTAAYQGYLAQSAVHMDQMLARLQNHLQQEAANSRTALLVVGTTCQAPIHTEVNLNLALAQAGLLRLGRGGFVIVQSSKAIAYSSGGAAHVYVNLAGRETEGIVPPDQYEEIQAEIAEVLAGLVDPLTGEPVLSRIVWRDELPELHLDGSYAGDLFVQAKPGYYLNDDRRAGSVFESVDFNGQQGYDSALTELQGILIVSGPGLRPSSFEGTVTLLDIAPSIASLLGVELLDSDGRVVLEWTAP